jgi:serine/threonine-protein kinase
MTEASREESEVFFSESAPAKAALQTFGRYVLHHAIARGGMARVYTARLIGAEGFNRLVAAKRLHPQFTDDPEFVTMFHDEARIASKIHHPNVVPVLDVVVEGSEVILVQEYVHGVPLDTLFKATLVKETPIPVPIVVAIVAGVLSGLHAAHETTDEMDQPLNIVHRDVSPQNVMVSVDGIPRLLDFGIARARSSAHVTREGFFKGKVAYMAPEQLRAENVTRTADIYAAGVLLWELLAHRRLHSAGSSEVQIFSAVLSGALPSLTAALEDERASIDDQRWQQIAALDPIVERALATLPENRYGNASAMLDVLLDTCPPATSIEVAHWVKLVGAAYLDRRNKVLASSEESWRSHSKVTAAAATSSTMPVARDVSMMKPTSQRSDVPDPWAPIASAWPLGGAPEGAPAPASRRIRLPWVAAASLLVMSATLTGVLAAGGDPAPVEVARNLVLPTALPAAAAALPEPAPAPSPSALTLTITRPPSPPAAAPAPPPARVAASKPAPAPTHDPPAPAATSPSPPAAQAKAECDPPFYFDGAKKLYKPGCL